MARDPLVDEGWTRQVDDAERALDGHFDVYKTPRQLGSGQAIRGRVFAAVAFGAEPPIADEQADDLVVEPPVDRVERVGERVLEDGDSSAAQVGVDPLFTQERVVGVTDPPLHGFPGQFSSA